MAVVSGTRWAPEVILDAAKRAVDILAQCDIRGGLVRLHEFNGPQRYRYLLTPDSREFARRSGLAKPAIFFVEERCNARHSMPRQSGAQTRRLVPR